MSTKILLPGHGDWAYRVNIPGHIALFCISVFLPGKYLVQLLPGHGRGALWVDRLRRVDCLETARAGQPVGKRLL